MTSATTITEEPVINIDKSRNYNINAGKCEHCGNFKTWEFRVQNPKSGKMMPGHVTADGFKINNGDCPYWAAMRSRKNSGNIGSSTARKKPGGSNESIKIRDGMENGIHKGLSSLKIVKGDSDTVIIEVATEPKICFKISRDDAKDLVFDIANAFD